MTLEDDIKALSKHQQFARFVQSILERREQAIHQLGNADKDSIIKIAGEIAAYDDILLDCNHEILLKSWSEVV